MPHTRKPATSAQVRKMLGLPDDEIVAKILNLDASYDDILEAIGWLKTEEYACAQLEKPMTEKVSRIYEILSEGWGIQEDN